FAGRGLGLALVQAIVRDHHGVIRLTSELGRGTTVEIYLPASSYLPVQASSSAPRERTSDSGYTILLAEDDQALRLAVSKLLRKKGFRVIEASDGPDTVDRFRSSGDKVDVIILDLNMPGLSSGDVVEEIRRMRPEVKIILTTAYSRDKASEFLEQ